MSIKVFSVSINADIAAQITREAQLQGLSRSAFIGRMFETWQQAKRDYFKEYAEYDLDELVQEMNDIIEGIDNE